jgi:hypothetical protein
MRYHWIPSSILAPCLRCVDYHQYAAEESLRPGYDRDMTPKLGRWIFFFARGTTLLDRIYMTLR